MKKLKALSDAVSASTSNLLSTWVNPYLKPWQDKALDRWEALNNREQVIVSALGLTLIFAVFMLVVYLPMMKRHEQARDIYQSRVELLSWMNSVAPQLKGQGSDADSPSAQSMMNEVNQRAAAYQLKLDRVQPEGVNKLRVWIQEGSFDSVMRWLNELQSESGIVASSVSFDAESALGIISAKVVLQGS